MSTLFRSAAGSNQTGEVPRRLVPPRQRSRQQLPQVAYARVPRPVPARRDSRQAADQDTVGGPATRLDNRVVGRHVQERPAPHGGALKGGLECILQHAVGKHLRVRAERELRERLGLGERAVALSLSAKRPHKNLLALIGDGRFTRSLSLQPLTADGSAELMRRSAPEAPIDVCRRCHDAGC